MQRRVSVRIGFSYMLVDHVTPTPTGMRVTVVTMASVMSIVETWALSGAHLSIIGRCATSPAPDGIHRDADKPNVSWVFMDPRLEPTHRVGYPAPRTVEPQKVLAPWMSDGGVSKLRSTGAVSDIAALLDHGEAGWADVLAILMGKKVADVRMVPHDIPTAMRRFFPHAVEDMSGAHPAWRKP